MVIEKNQSYSLNQIRDKKMFLIETFDLNTGSEPFSNCNTLLETLQWATVVNIIANIPIIILLLFLVLDIYKNPDW